MTARIVPMGAAYPTVGASGREPRPLGVGQRSLGPAGYGARENLGATTASMRFPRPGADWRGGLWGRESPGLPHAAPSEGPAELPLDDAEAPADSLPSVRGGRPWPPSSGVAPTQKHCCLVCASKAGTGEPGETKEV